MSIWYFTFVPCSRIARAAKAQRVSWLPWLMVLWASSAYAQTSVPQPGIWSMYYANGAYNFVSESTAINNNSVLHYATYDAGTATLTWNPGTNVFVSVVFNPPTGGSVTYVNAGASSPAGALSMTGTGTNALQSIGSAPYSCNGTLALAGPPGGSFFRTFVYASETYIRSQEWIDMLGVSQYIFEGGSGGVAQAQSEGSGIFEGLQIMTAGGAIAKYSAQGPCTYLRSTDSTGTNTLSSIDNFAVTTGVSTAKVVSPCSSFVYNGEFFGLSALFWEADGSIGCNSYSYNGSNGHYGVITVNGSTITDLNVDYSDGQNYDDYVNGENYGRPGTFYYMANRSTNGNHLTAIGGQPYVSEGLFAVPAPSQVPASIITSFDYQGASYTLWRVPAWANGYAVYQFHSQNGGTATVSVDPNTQRVASWTISPDSSHSATYVDGAASGHPGSYVWQDGSTASNALSAVNNVSYTVNGNLSSSSSGSVIQGNMVVQGSQFNLGCWETDFSHSGLFINYQDGADTVDSTISMMSSRPETDWIWGHVTGDYSDSEMAMELDDSHKLSLYQHPPIIGSAGPEAGIVLDPNGTSTYNQPVRFNAPVHIEPQGDLQMGDFHSEPTQ